MGDKPIRIQRKRTKGWKSPEGAVYVGRGSMWGNPFTMKDCRDAGFFGTDTELLTRCSDAFEAWLVSPYWRTNWDGAESEKARQKILDGVSKLLGKSLMCWCALDQPCHATVLLELANAPATPSTGDV